ncbi:hypothetical protein MEG1DRAFT_03748 [Photorhabdus temperata subsp. temperata Meg1]|uniref:Uncharacterized protein n=1 Tax=Photorhabdus temperata subsp. temperata Meg1 TaxID=1393735 RepID=A0A081RSL4_PHOTE|nr:hypothetical protein B738_18379 [Photorhabdus temperata subsp. temperata M1021]KER01667.1 hypothetical protein MEG1DRAFT_03748 [Photorhabdus temperata subsp. temperata Meg1]
MLLKVIILTYSFNQYKVFTIIFTDFNTCFLLSLIIIGYHILCLTNVNHTHLLSLLMLFYWQSQAVLISFLFQSLNPAGLTVLSIFLLRYS